VLKRRKTPKTVLKTGKITISGKIAQFHHGQICPIKVPKPLFTREYTQCTAGHTFCFVVGVVGGVVMATFSQTWQYFSQQLMKHDWT
jgi:hypothetical protein